MRIYLDNCCFNRPFDDQKQIKVHLESEKLAADGIKAKDALHISCAVYAGCKYFLTTDKRLLNLNISEINIVSPIDFLNEMEE